MNYESYPFFALFDKICSIPHGSGNTAAISRFCLEYAKSLSLDCRSDEAGNVIIFKPGTKGRENEEPVILQGHLDMVCAGSAGCDADMSRSGITPVYSNGWIKADGTTLGADNGIAVAYCLALMADNSLSHPPLEIIFTVDEEVGMLGAAALDVSSIRSRRMINLDSEDEGIFTAGCAGGATVRFTLPLLYENFTGHRAVLRLSGLTGGHSGIMISKGRANSCKLIAQLSEKLGGRLVSINGGQKDNAIADFAIAELMLPAPAAPDSFHTLVSEIKHAFSLTDPKLSVSLDIEPDTSTARVMQSISPLQLINALPNGVQSYVPDMADLPETSLNLGIAKTYDAFLEICCSLRSCVPEKLDALIAKLTSIGDGFNARSSVSGCYPPWPYTPNSPLQKTVTDTYRSLTGREAVTDVIHAGLECGIFSRKLPGLDAISFGPTMLDVHTPQERLSIESAIFTWKLLLKILENL